MKILIIDNYDSFTYNLAQLVYRETQTTPIIIRNDELDYDSISQLAIDGIIISAGPGRPENRPDLGVAYDIITQAEKPVLGICLGMQAIVHCHAGSIEYAPEQMHGRTSVINHNATGLFTGIPQQFTAMRYHSLIVNPNLPSDIIRTAWTNDDIVMAIQHVSRPLWGVQFHPESISTSHGSTLIKNFLREIKPSEQIVKPILPEVATIKNTEKSSLRIKQYQHWIDPLKVFEKLYSAENYNFWLDSNSTEHDLSTISYMGDNTGPRSYVVQYNNNGTLLIDNESIPDLHLYDYLDNKLKQYRIEDNTNLPFAFRGGFVGWLGYELNPDSEKESTTSPKSDYPDAAFIFVDRYLLFDHKAKLIYLATVSLPDNSTQDEEKYLTWEKQTINTLDTLYTTSDKANLREQLTPKQQALTFQITKSHQDYIDDITLAKEKIRQGESYELCLTNQISTEIKSSGLDIYKVLRHSNSAPFSSYLHFSDIEVLSSSPERFLAIDQNRTVTSKPIKGTIARGTTPQTDESNKHFLQTNIKDSAENLMIVDLLRNDISKVCQNGSVKVPKLLEVESFATVHQLVSTIEGTLDKDKTVIDCIKACFPGGSMTGAPKIRSIKILAEMETQARGIYSGALGYLSLNGCCDLSIIIRTIVIHQHQANIGCGGAIVSLSNPEQEYAEILLKAKSLIEAIVKTETGQLDSVDYKILD